MACIELEDVRLHYQIDGKNDRPFLVFSNAVGTNLHLWDSVLAPMAAHYRIVRYDTRGHGGSSAPVGDYTLGTYSAAMYSLCSMRLRSSDAIFAECRLGG
jgi:3-oxoadipate enol-lactonase